MDPILELHIKLPGLPSSQSGVFGSFWARRTHDQNWAKRVIQATREALIWEDQEIILEECNLVCVRASFGKVAPDYDNLVSSFKPLIDAWLPVKTDKQIPFRMGLIRSDDDSVIKTRVYKWVTAPPGKGLVHLFLTGRVVMIDSETKPKNGPEST